MILGPTCATCSNVFRPISTARSPTCCLIAGNQRTDCELLRHAHARKVERLAAYGASTPADDVAVGECHSGVSNSGKPETDTPNSRRPCPETKVRSGLLV